MLECIACRAHVMTCIVLGACFAVEAHRNSSVGACAMAPAIFVVSSLGFEDAAYSADVMICMYVCILFQWRSRKNQKLQGQVSKTRGMCYNGISRIENEVQQPKKLEVILFRS